MLSVDIPAAFLIGLVGSLHCVGMCGPIVIALPSGNRIGIGFIGSRLIYNIGRVLTYTFLGTLVGLVGAAINVGAYQQTLSIVCGLLLISYVIIPRLVSFSPVVTSSLDKINAPFQKLWQRFFGLGSNRSLFVVGLLNGFLPCGLVYVALAGASLTGQPIHGGLFMLFFGFGTIPIMLATSVAGRLVGTKVRRRLSLLLPLMTILVGGLLIVRGLSLGIPYVSPKITTTGGGETLQCCPPDSIDQFNADSTVSQ